jgi:GTP cyclohydrolase I
MREPNLYKMLLGPATDLIRFCGEDPERPGLLETPYRFARAWLEWTDGYGVEPASVLKEFDDGAEGCDQLVIVKDIPVYSHCEHHLAPFWGVAHVGYIPNRKIVGLSKLARLVDVFAHRLQVQERMTNQIANALQEVLEPTGVGVMIRCRHMCMESRGVRRKGAETITSALRGAILDEPEARQEFYAICR